MRRFIFGFMAFGFMTVFTACEPTKSGAPVVAVPQVASSEPAAAVAVAVAVEAVKPAASAPQMAPTLEEALSFIESRLSQQTIGETMWVVTEMKLRGNPWIWKESQLTTHGETDQERMLNAKVTHEYYSVDPKALAVPVIVKDRNVDFECRDSKCFQVKRSIASTKSKGVPLSENDEVRNKNAWHFSNEQEAKRVATALNRALELLGATQAKF